MDAQQEGTGDSAAAPAADAGGREPSPVRDPKACDSRSAAPTHAPARLLTAVVEYACCAAGRPGETGARPAPEPSPPAPAVPAAAAAAAPAEGGARQRGGGPRRKGGKGGRQGGDKRARQRGRGKNEDGEDAWCRGAGWLGEPARCSGEEGAQKRTSKRRDGVARRAASAGGREKAWPRGMARREAR